MSFVEIDLENFPRRKHFEYFSSLQYPYVGTTSNVDVTELVQFCKDKNYSFYLVFVHIAALAADSVRELRQRIRNGKVIEYSECPTSHTELRENGTYCFCTLHHKLNLDEYIIYADTARKQCLLTNRIDEDDEDDEDDVVESMYFISTLPWIHYTALIQPVACGEESNPRITWGKFQEDFHGRKQLPVTILAHHGLVDGIHIARFYHNLEEQINKIIY